MRYFWTIDQVDQLIFELQWAPGLRNIGYYQLPQLVNFSGAGLKTVY